jgi:hypothetical protein
MRRVLCFESVSSAISMCSMIVMEEKHTVLADIVRNVTLVQPCHWRGNGDCEQGQRPGNMM